MFDDTPHPTDETLLRAIDGELSARVDARLERHLVTCETCRLRQQHLASAVAGVSRAYREAGVSPPPDAEALRARMRERMTALSTAWDNSWRVRMAERFATLPQGSFIGAAVLTGVILALTFGAWPRSTRPVTPVDAIESAALPIRSVTPGATRPVRVEDICEGRLPARAPIPATVRQAILRDYGVENLAPEEYELDYLITPELGGTAERGNLWPERVRLAGLERARQG